MARARRTTTTRPRKIRYAVIGQGYFAQTAVLPAFAHARNSQLVALFSEDTRKLRALRRTYGVEHALGYDEYDAFLRSGAVDAIYIALPNNLHAEYTVRAARAGVNVLCEEPMATTEEECQQMIRACDDARVKLMIAYRLHFEEATLRAIELVRARRLGDPRLFSSALTFQVKPGNTRTRAAGGGPLFDLGIYCVNAARCLFGDEPEDVLALSARGGDRRFREIEEQLTAVMRFPRQRLACFTVGFNAEAASWLEVLGEKGKLRLDPAYPLATSLRHVLTVGGKTREQVFAKRDQVAPELVYFSECVARGRQPEPSGAEGLADVRVLRALLRSTVSGRVERLGPLGGIERPTRRTELRRPASVPPPLVNAQPPSE
jgi:glucose-fructose oxidoreductase